MRTVRVAIASTVFLFVFASHLLAATVQVGTCRNSVPSFATIQAAVNASSAGGTVLVCPGSYAEQVGIDKALNLFGVLSGTEKAAVIVAPSGGIVQNTTSLSSGNPIAAQILVTNATGVNISNLTVDGANSQISVGGCSPVNLVGVLYQNASGTVNHLAVINQALTGVSIGCQSGLGIFVQSGNSGTSNVRIVNNYVENYQKNGITANEAGTTVTITANNVVGQGPTTGAAENSIQVGFGAAGQVSGNVAMDDIFSPDTISGSGNAASGILVFASTGVTVTGNTVGNTQFGIAFVSDATAGPADNGTIQGNRISATRVFDGVELCGSGNTVIGNTISGSDESGVHIDSTCGAVASNTVSKNTINDACAGILVGTAAGSNTIGTNNFYNTRNTTLTADTCTPPVMAPTPLLAAHAAAASAATNHARPSPARP